MSVKKAYKRATPKLRAKNAAVSGKVTLAAKALDRAALYSWEYSLDSSTWTPVADTMRSRTEVSGLTSARVYYFRFRAFTCAGRHEYSQVVSLIVQSREGRPTFGAGRPRSRSCAGGSSSTGGCG